MTKMFSLILGTVIQQEFGSGEEHLKKVKKNIDWDILKEMGCLVSAGREQLAAGLRR